MTSKEKLIKDIKELLRRGYNLYYTDAIKNNKLSEKQQKELMERESFKEYFENFFTTPSEYQKWYSLSSIVIRQVLPDRFDEFRDLYKLQKRRDDKIDFITYTISDYLIGLSVTKGLYKEEVVNPFSAFSTKFQTQLSILSSCVDRIESSLSDIEGVLQFELFENEIEAAKELLSKKHVRAAGMLVGVTLEGHLKQVCKNHEIKFRKKSPTISDFNEELKKLGVIDVPTWRLIQRLGDIRNLCAHPKERDPTNDEIEDLIRGTEKLISEVN